MKFLWIPYTDGHAVVAETFLDSEAVKNTGIEDGWDDYVSYWKNEPSVNYGEDFFAFMIKDGEEYVAVIAVGLHEGELSVPEIIVSPEKRGRGVGGEILTELLSETVSIIGKEKRLARAVIFPRNEASKRAFLKAGFEYESSHPDGDADYYIWKPTEN